MSFTLAGCFAERITRCRVFPLPRMAGGFVTPSGKFVDLWGRRWKTPRPEDRIFTSHTAVCGSRFRDFPGTSRHHRSLGKDDVIELQTLAKNGRRIPIKDVIGEP